MSRTSTRDEHQAWRAVAHAQSIVSERLEVTLSEHGLPALAWCEVLISLDGVDERRLRMFELAGAVVMSRSGLTRLIDRIETAGLIRRESCPTDRRGAFVALTPEGEEVLARARPVYHAALHQHFGVHLTAPRAIADALEPVTQAACRGVREAEASGAAAL